MNVLKYILILHLLFDPGICCLLKKKALNVLNQVMPGPWNDAELSLKRTDCECGHFGSLTSPKFILFISYHADVELNNNIHMHGCIGTIISSNLIATSHKCVQREAQHTNVFEQWDLHRSTYNRSIIDEADLVVSSEPNAEGELFQVEKIILNGRHILNSYKASSDSKNDIINDILLIKLKIDFTSHKFHKPICIPDNHEIDFFGKEGTYFGHGAGDHPQNNVDGITGVVKHLDMCYHDTIEQNQEKKQTKNLEPMCIKWEEKWSSLVLLGGPLVFQSQSNGAYFFAGVMGYGNNGIAFFANILGMRKYILHRAKQHSNTLCRESILTLSNVSTEVESIDDGDKLWRPRECVLDINKRPIWAKRFGGRTINSKPTEIILYIKWNEFHRIEIVDMKCNSVNKTIWNKAEQILLKPRSACVNFFSNEDCSGQYTTLPGNEKQSIKTDVAVGWTIQSYQNCTDKLGGGLSEIQFFNEDKTLLQTYIAKDMCQCALIPGSVKSVINNGICIVTYEDETCEKKVEAYKGGTGIQVDDLTTYFTIPRHGNLYEPVRKHNPVKSFSVCDMYNDRSCDKLHIVIFKVVIPELLDTKKKLIIHSSTITNQNFKKLTKKEKGASLLTEYQETSVLESVTGIFTAGIQAVDKNDTEIRSKNELKIVEGIRQAYDKKIHSNTSTGGIFNVTKTKAIYYNGHWEVPSCSRYEGNIEVWAYSDVSMEYKASVMIYVTNNCKIVARKRVKEMLDAIPHGLEITDGDDKSEIIIAKGKGRLTTTFVPNAHDTVFSGKEFNLPKNECKQK